MERGSFHLTRPTKRPVLESGGFGRIGKDPRLAPSAHTFISPVDLVIAKKILVRMLADFNCAVCLKALSSLFFKVRELTIAMHCVRQTPRCKSKRPAAPKHFGATQLQRINAIRAPKLHLKFLWQAAGHNACNVEMSWPERMVCLVCIGKQHQKSTKTIYGKLFDTVRRHAK